MKNNFLNNKKLEIKSPLPKSLNIKVCFASEDVGWGDGPYP